MATILMTTISEFCATGLLPSERHSESLPKLYKKASEAISAAVRHDESATSMGVDYHNHMTFSPAWKTNTKRHVRRREHSALEPSRKRRRGKSRHRQNAVCEGFSAYTSADIDALRSNGLAERVVAVLRLVCEDNRLLIEDYTIRHNSPLRKLWMSSGSCIESTVDSIMTANFMSRSVIIIALVLFDRLQMEGRDCIIAIHETLERLFGLCVLLAAKFVEDVPVWNSDMLHIINFDCVEDIHEMEVELLNVLKWNICVPSATYERYENAIMRPLE